MRLSIFVTITDPIERQDPIIEALQSYLDLADEVVVVDGSFQTTLKVSEFIKIMPHWYQIQDQMDLIDHVKSKNLKWVTTSRWPEKFDWPFIGQQFQRGYEACTGDWVIHADCDYIFHEEDIPKIRQLLADSPDELAFSFWKYQFLLTDRYNIKSRTVLAVNKKEVW